MFPPLIVNVIRVGETGGFLGAAMESIARTYTNESELQNKVRAAVTYPIIVLAIAILGVIAMVTFVVPVFAGMFAGLGSQLPLPTQVLVAVSSNMWWILPVLLVCVGALLLVWRRQRRTESYRRVVDPMKLKLPVFGSMITKIAVARFARNLAMMLDAGVPLVQGLDVVGKASDNWAVEQAVHGIQDSIRDGKSFSAPLAKAAVFPPMVAQMVSVGEESGTLSQMLASIADFYEKEVETATSQLTVGDRTASHRGHRHHHRRHGGHAVPADLHHLRGAEPAVRRRDHTATRSTSSIVVRPCATLLQPSSRSAIMPCSSATWRIAVPVARVTTSCSSSSLIIMTSWRAMRPR